METKSPYLCEQFTNKVNLFSVTFVKKYSMYLLSIFAS